jgi:hypothetical protein
MNAVISGELRRQGRICGDSQCRLEDGAVRGHSKCLRCFVSPLELRTRAISFCAYWLAPATNQSGGAQP